MNRACGSGGGESAVWALLTFLIGSPSIALAQANVDFRAATAYAVAAEPNSMVLHDLDGDGHLDVAAAAFRASAVSILLGDGTGALRRLADAGTIGTSLGVAAGRFDNDALPDLIVSQRESDNLWLLRNLGGGAFAAPRLVLGGHDPWPVVAVDFDNDGMLDAVQALAPEVGGRVNVLYGNGDGTFGEPVGTSTGGANSALAVADFDRDGRLDAIATNLGRASVAVLLGREDGTLAPRLESAVGDEPAGIATADLDGDDILDIVVSSTIGDAVTVSRGIGDGRFLPATYYSVGDAPVGIALTDINVDGTLDIVVGNRGTGGATVSVLVGDSAGDFAPARTFVADRAPFALAAGDLNGDDVPDIVTVNGGEIVASVPQSTVTVLLGNGATLDAVEQLTSPAASTALAIADVDGDALPDIVVALQTADALAVYRSGAQSFSAATIDLTAAPTALALADLDGDDRIDIIAAADDSPNLVLLMNRGGSFTDAVAVPAGGEAVAIGAADYDNDGAVDLVAALGASNEIALLRGDGDGGFAAPVLIGLSARPVALASGDFDASAPVDVAVALASGAVAILRGATGGLEVPADVPVAAGPVGLAALDVNADAFDDLAVAHASGVVQLLIGAGAGGFSSGASFGGVEMPSSISARDVTGDGRADLLVSERLRDAVAVLAANGASGFAPPVHFRVGDNPRAARAGDFDGDGGYDFAAACVQPAVAFNRRSGALRGDANGDGGVAAADLVAIARAARRARCIAVERYARSATDADGDGVVCPQDLRAGLRRIFDPAMSPVEGGSIDG